MWSSKALLKLDPADGFEKKIKQRSKKLKWITQLVKDDFNILIISLLIGIAISLLGLTTALFSKRLIDDIIPKANLSKLISSSCLVLLLLLMRSLLSYVRGLFVVRQGQDFNNRIIQSFYSNLLNLPKAFFDTRKTGELIARMNDTRRIQSVLSTISGSIVIDLLLVVVSLSFVFVYSWPIGLIMSASLPVYFYILYFFNGPVIRTQKEVMSGYAMAESNFVDTIQGVADIKMLNKQVFFEGVNRSTFEAFQQRISSLGKLNIKFSFASEIAGSIFIITTFSVSSWLVLSKELELGEMVALLGMSGNIVPALTRLVVANIQIQEALVAFDRMFEFTSMEKEARDGKNFLPVDPCVDIQNLSFRFPGRNEILRSVTMNFRKGEIVALLGESGGGKSTLLQIVQKFYAPEAGRILIGQTDLRSIDTELWRQVIAAVPQDIKIFNGHLLYNITLSDNQEDYERAVTFCEEKGFGKYFGEFPQGYLTLIGEEGINISGGQKQLVALVRALFRIPQVLLLDEATSAMDNRMEAFVLALLQKEKHKMSILIVTHREKIARFCDRIYLLEDGTIS